MKKYFLIFVIFLSFFVSQVYAEVSASTGFLSNQIWYSQDSIIEGKTIKIYTAVWNGDNSSLYAKIEFYDKNVILGTRKVVILPKQLLEISVPWQVTSGDHIISAKIISSSLNTTSGKKEIIVLKRNTTISDRQFVPAVVKTKDGKLLTNNELVSNELNKIGEKINKVVPISVKKPVLEGLTSIDNFRNQTLNKIINNKKKAQAQVLSFNVPSTVNTSSSFDSPPSSEKNLLGEEIINKTFFDKIQIVKKSKSLENATGKPIAEIKLFFLKILEYIFSHKFVFYGLIILTSFYLLRIIYRKIRNN